MIHFCIHFCLQPANLSMLGLLYLFASNIPRYDIYLHSMSHQSRVILVTEQFLLRKINGDIAPQSSRGTGGTLHPFHKLFEF